MIALPDYLARDAVGLAELLARREVSARELLEVAIARTEAVNPLLNAVVTPMYEHALRRASEPLEGPFAGVPFLLKDLRQEYAGVPDSRGSSPLRRARYAPPAHAEITRRWLAAGLVVFGRTNTPEFGAKGITEPAAWGATRNPFSLDHSPGGSSGGAAAAVAAGIVPMAGASDGGGSIRIPASATGLFGLKPGRGRTPTGPRRPDANHGAVLNHVISRSVRDSAHMLDATHGDEPGVRGRLAPPPRPYAEEVEREPGRLRIGFSVRSPIGTEVDSEAIEAVESAARLLVSLGHEVVPAEPAVDGMQLAGDWLRMWFVAMTTEIAEARALTGCSEDEFELETRLMAALGREMRAAAYFESVARWGEHAYQLSSFHRKYDLYMTPTLALLPPKVGALDTPPVQRGLLRAALALGATKLLGSRAHAVDAVVRDNLRPFPFTQLANVTGAPAMSVPLHTAASGLPVGVQFVGDQGGEGLLFSLAAQLERAAPWAMRRPDV